MVGSEYHGGIGTEGIVSSFLVDLVPAASCVEIRMLVQGGRRPRLATRALKENAKVTNDVLVLLVVVLAKRRDSTTSAATNDGHGRHQQRRGAMLFRAGIPTALAWGGS